MLAYFKRFFLCLCRGELHLEQVILNRIDTLETNIMSAYTQFLRDQQTYNGKLKAVVDDIADDIGTLNEKITELQNSSGAVTSEDQTIIDDLQAQAQATLAKLDGLNALTPPKTPPVTTPPVVTDPVVTDPVVTDPTAPTTE